MARNLTPIPGKPCPCGAHMAFDRDNYRPGMRKTMSCEQYLRCQSFSPGETGSVPHRVHEPLPPNMHVVDED
jgi:hypothetical protein